jgi:hypothetical protein
LILFPSFLKDVEPSSSSQPEATQQHPVEINNYVLQITQELTQLCIQVQQQQIPKTKTTPEPKVGAPDSFSGEKDKINVFLALCENTFTAHPSIYSSLTTQNYNLQARVSFAASYL